MNVVTCSLAMRSFNFRERSGQNRANFWALPMVPWAWKAASAAAASRTIASSLWAWFLYQLYDAAATTIMMKAPTSAYPMMPLRVWLPHLVHCWPATSR